MAMEEDFSEKNAELVVFGNWVLEDVHGNIEKYFQQTKEWKHHSHSHNHGDNATKIYIIPE